MKDERRDDLHISPEIMKDERRDDLHIAPETVSLSSSTRPNSPVVLDSSRMSSPTAESRLDSRWPRRSSGQFLMKD